MNTAGWWIPKKWLQPCKPYHPESKQLVPETLKVASKKYPSSFLSNCLNWILVFFGHSSLPPQKKDKAYTKNKHGTWIYPPPKGDSYWKPPFSDIFRFYVKFLGSTTYFWCYVYFPPSLPGHLGSSSSSARFWSPTPGVHETTTRTTFTKAEFLGVKMCVKDDFGLKHGGGHKWALRTLEVVCVFFCLCVCFFGVWWKVVVDHGSFRERYFMDLGGMCDYTCM